MSRVWRSSTRPVTGGGGPPLLIGQEHSPFVGLAEEPPLRGLIVRDFAHVDAFTALSSADAEEFAAILPVPCFALPNPVSLTEVNGAGAPDATETGWRSRWAATRREAARPDDRGLRSRHPRARAAALAAEGYGWGPEEDRLAAVIAERMRRTGSG